MSTIAPKGQRWTYEDYVNIPDDGQRHEIIDGEHLVNPSPSTQHQHVSKRLQYQLYTKIELAGLGVLYDAPIDVQLSEFDIVQPDLVIILNESIRKITANDVKTIAKTLIPAKNMVISIVGDMAKVRTDLDKLNLGEPVMHDLYGMPLKP